ncbi:hypothetical protein PC129_g21767, partial [Phytophthora cactorum]
MNTECINLRLSLQGAQDVEALLYRTDLPLLTQLSSESLRCTTWFWGRGIGDILASNSGNIGVENGKMIFGVGIHTGIDHVRSILNGLGDDMNRGALVDFRDVESGVLPLIGGGAPGNLSGEEKLQAGLWITK